MTFPLFIRTLRDKRIDPLRLIPKPAHCGPPRRKFRLVELIPSKLNISIAKIRLDSVGRTRPVSPAKIDHQQPSQLFDPFISTVFGCGINVGHIISILVIKGKPWPLQAGTASGSDRAFEFLKIVFGLLEFGVQRKSEMTVCFV